MRTAMVRYDLAHSIGLEQQIDGAAMMIAYPGNLTNIQLWLVHIAPLLLLTSSRIP
jgi:hypothetical protein